MKSEQAVLRQIDIYKQELVMAITEKTLSRLCDPEVDLQILTLVDKLEALLWVADLEISEAAPLNH